MSGEINQQLQSTELQQRQQSQREQRLDQRQENKINQQMVQQSITTTTSGELPPLGPPPLYQEIYPVQPHYWNDQSWPPPPPPHSSHNHHQASFPWPTGCPPVRYHLGRSSNANDNIFIRGPNRIRPTVKWFLSSVTFMMVFSLLCAFVYFLLITVNFK